MTDQSPQAKPTGRVGTYLYFSSLYFITVGVLYLWGYWSPFQVNILEYMSLADVVKYTAYPIASTSVFLAVGIVVGNFGAIQSGFRVGEGRDSQFGQALRKAIPFRLLAIAYFAGTAALFVFGPITKWLLLPTLMAAPFMYASLKSGWFDSLIPNESVRFVVLLCLTTLPTFSYGQGRLSAEWVRTGSSFQYAVSTVDHVDVSPNASPSSRLRFLGHAGDVFFFFDPAREAVVVAKMDATKALVLKDFRQSQPVAQGQGQGQGQVSPAGPASAASSSVPRAKP